MERVVTFIHCMIISQFCITVFLEENDVPSVKTTLKEKNYPSRLHLILYIVNREKKSDCVYRYQKGSLVCVEEPAYPLNRLRNIAIQNIRTTHFIVFDMDMWPASGYFSLYMIVENLYDTLLNLPPEYLRSDFVVTIIPAFSLPEYVIKSPKCKNLKSCITLLSFCFSVIIVERRSHIQKLVMI